MDVLQAPLPSRPTGIGDRVRCWRRCSGPRSAHGCPASRRRPRERCSRPSPGVRARLHLLREQDSTSPKPDYARLFARARGWPGGPPLRRSRRVCRVGNRTAHPRGAAHVPPRLGRGREAPGARNRRARLMTIRGWLDELARASGRRTDLFWQALLAGGVESLMRRSRPYCRGWRGASPAASRAHAAVACRRRASRPSSEASTSWIPSSGSSAHRRHRPLNSLRQLAVARHDQSRRAIKSGL